MLIKFYKTLSEPKSYPKILQNELLVNGTIRDENGFDIMNPTLRVVDINPLLYNYLYIEEFSRYYFIVKPIYYRNNVYDLVLHEDVLQSHYAKFELLDAFINRNENDYNPMIKDDRIPLYPSQNDIIVPLSEVKGFEKPDSINTADIIIGVTSGYGINIANNKILFMSGNDDNVYDSYIVSQAYTYTPALGGHTGIDLVPKISYGSTTTDLTARVQYPFSTPDLGKVHLIRPAGDSSSWGNNVIVKINSSLADTASQGHASHFCIFAHLNYINPKLSVGDLIDADTFIGVVGNTGDSKATHLHFGVFQDGSIFDDTPSYPNRVNPAPFLEIPNEVNYWVRGLNSN